MSKDISRKMSVDTSSEVEDEPKKVKRPRETTSNKEIVEILTRCEESFKKLSEDMGKIKQFIASGSLGDIKVKKQKIAREPQPMSGYQYFLKKFREQHKGLDNKTIFKDGAKEWQSLSSEEHEKYKQLSKDVFYKQHPDAERKPEKTSKSSPSKSKKAVVENVDILPKPIIAVKSVEISSPPKSEKKKKHHHKHRESVSSEGDVKTEKKKKHHSKKEKSTKIDEDAPTESE